MQSKIMSSQQFDRHGTHFPITKLQAVIFTQGKRKSAHEKLRQPFRTFYLFSYVNPGCLDPGRILTSCDQTSFRNTLQCILILK